MSKRERTVSLENSVSSLSGGSPNSNAEPQFPRAVIVCDIDNTIKTGNQLNHTPAIAGMPELLDRLQKWYEEVIKGASPAPSRKTSMKQPPKQKVEGEDEQQKGDEEEIEAEAPPPATGSRVSEVYYLSNRYGPFSYIRLGPEGFLTSNAFPKGQVLTRSWSDLRGFFTKHPAHKATQLNNILKTATHCVLLGDSTENDLQVYLDYLRTTASATLKDNAVVAIRMIDEARDKERMDKLAQEKKQNVKLIFWKESEELKKALEGFGILR